MQAPRVQRLAALLINYSLKTRKREIFNKVRELSRARKGE